MAAIKPYRAGKETRTPSGWKGLAQEETLEGAGHAGSGGGQLAPLKGLWELGRITQTTPVDHTAACFPPIFSNFLWSPPFPSPHTTCRAMVLRGFYTCSALHVGTEPWEPPQPFNPVELGPCSLLPPPAQATRTPNLELQEGHTSTPVSAPSHPSESSRGFISRRCPTPPRLQGGQVKPLLL